MNIESLFVFSIVYSVIFGSVFITGSSCVVFPESYSFLTCMISSLSGIFAFFLTKLIFFKISSVGIYVLTGLNFLVFFILVSVNRAYVAVCIMFGQYIGCMSLLLFKVLVKLPYTIRYVFWMCNGERTIRKFLNELGITVSPTPQKSKDREYFECEDAESGYDIVIRDSRTWRSWILSGHMGMGESYTKGWWDCPDLTNTVFKFRRITGEVPKHNFHVYYSYHMVIWAFLHKMFNMQGKMCSKILAEKHYNYSNEHYEELLDPWMQYTCAYYGRGAKSLNEAQIDKMTLICEKLGLEKGGKKPQTVLDIGCGWGNLVKFISDNYENTKVVGVTLSSEQALYARNLNNGNDRVTILQMDYRNIDKETKFDAITCIGCLEHIGVKNYQNFFESVKKLLNEDGLALIQVIGTRKTSMVRSYSWIGKFIFPFGMLPSNKQLSEVAENVGLIIEDWHNFGYDYYRTLLGWKENLEKVENKHIEEHGERSYRKWDYYIQICAGEFKARRVQLWQVVFSRNGLKSGYKSVR